MHPAVAAPGAHTQSPGTPVLEDVWGEPLGTHSRPAPAAQCSGVAPALHSVRTDAP